VIVLDEQLLGRNLELEIARWYRGAIQSVVDLRPNSVIKDEAIPSLLRRLPGPTFVTINERDSWHPALAGEQYCLVCLALPDSRAREIPQLLRTLSRLPEFRTKARRTGKVIRITEREVSYYTTRSRALLIVH
jgi:hypothetical protein